MRTGSYAPDSFCTAPGGPKTRQIRSVSGYGSVLVTYTDVTLLGQEGDFEPLSGNIRGGQTRPFRSNRPNLFVSRRGVPWT